MMKGGGFKKNGIAKERLLGFFLNETDTHRACIVAPDFQISSAK